MSAAVLVEDPGDAIVRAAYDRTHGEGAYDEADAATDWGGRQILTADEFLAQEFIEPMWRVPGLLPAIGAGLILGAEKAGKSLLGLQLCLSVAAGVDFLGRRPTPCATLFVEEEGAPRSHQARLERQRWALGLSHRPDLPCYLAIREQIRLDDRTVVEWLRSEIRRRDIKVVVIGPLSQVAALEDENQAGPVNTLMRTINGLATELGILIVLVHHRRKDAAGSGTPNIREFFASARGSSALVAAVDVGLGVLREQEDAHGWLYVLHRDEVSYKEHYDFNPASLLVTSSPVPDRNVKAPPAEVLQLVRLDGPMAVGQIASRFGVAYNTANERLNTLIDQGLIHRLPGQGRKAQFAVTPTTPITWDTDEPGDEPTSPAVAHGTHGPDTVLSRANVSQLAGGTSQGADKEEDPESGVFHPEGSTRPPRKVKEGLRDDLNFDRNQYSRESSLPSVSRFNFKPVSSGGLKQGTAKPFKLPLNMRARVTTHS